jgi:phage baseplate assembly protein W
VVDNLNQLDLFLTERHTGWLTANRDLVDLRVDRGDVATVQGVANLAQAILNRLYTRQGELTSLGHPDYGSRLYQLVGEANNTRTQALAELYIRECLAQEPRIQEITEIVFASVSSHFDRNTLKVSVIVKLVGEETPLNLSLSLTGG